MIGDSRPTFYIFRVYLIRLAGIVAERMGVAHTDGSIHNADRNLTASRYGLFVYGYVLAVFDYVFTVLLFYGRFFVRVVEKTYESDFLRYTLRFKVIFNLFGNNIQKSCVNAARAAVSFFVFFASVAVARTRGVLATDHKVRSRRTVHVVRYEAVRNDFGRLRIRITKLSVFP